MSVRYEFYLESIISPPNTYHSHPNITNILQLYYNYIKRHKRILTFFYKKIKLNHKTCNKIKFCKNMKKLQVFLWLFLQNLKIENYFKRRRKRWQVV